VKDLRPLALPPAVDFPEQCEIHFTWSGCQDEVLTIRYSGVSSVEITADDGGHLELSDFNNVRLDEVFPHEAGCTHELRLTTGTVRIVCADLVAEWAPMTSE
jgi:hypothetical protein